MSFIKIKASSFRHGCLAAGVGASLAAGVLFYRQQIVTGFFVAYLGLSLVATAESSTDFTAEHTWRSFGKLLKGRSSISTFGKLCDITSYFCLAAALISWLVLR